MPPDSDTVRRFNRFYTRQIGLLEEGVLKSPFTLTEARVVYEMAHQAWMTPTQIGEALGLDAGYLSRIVRGFEARGLVERRPSESDRRQVLLALTDAGRAEFMRLDETSRTEIEAMLARLTAGEKERLLGAMRTIEELLGTRAEPRVPYILRSHRSGDLGWVVQRHGEVYAREYGWDERFEGLVAEVVARFALNFDAKRERCWIAEREGTNVGSVFLVRHPEREGVARLRLLLVDPSARGLGIGRRLVEECTRFARERGYHTITLWTTSVLTSARRIYESEGYRLVDARPHGDFGEGLIGETWELALDDREGALTLHPPSPTT